MSTLDFEVIEEESEEEPTPLESVPLTPTSTTPLPESPSNPRGISHFNPSQSLMFMDGSSIDRLYSSSITLSLMQQRRNHLPPIQEASSRNATVPAKLTPNVKQVNMKQFMVGKKGFTLLQAIHFLIENNLIFSRGEGFDFFYLLQCHHIFEPSLFSHPCLS